MSEDRAPHLEHRRLGPSKLRFALFTVSSSRYEAKLRGEEFRDDSMEEAVKAIGKGGHKVVQREVINDDIVMIRGKLAEALQREDVDVIVFMGGTGLTRRDVTIEAVRPMLEKEAEGFGDIFRYLSYREIGAAAALTRATAGVAKGKAVLCLPGSPKAVRLAFKEFLGELPHMLYLARR